MSLSEIHGQKMLTAFGGSVSPTSLRIGGIVSASLHLRISDSRFSLSGS